MAMMMMKTYAQGQALHIYINYSQSDSSIERQKLFRTPVSDNLLFRKSVSDSGPVSDTYYMSGLFQKHASDK